MGTWLVLSSLIAVCGFIAYTGDLLGRRLGKRRLSIFGLRPRHTAILCTVVTGMLIAGTMLGVLMGLSAGVRRAVLQGEELVYQNREFRLQRDGLQGETVRLQQEIQPLRQKNSELAQSNAVMEEANADLLQSEKDLKCKNQELEGANSQALGTLLKVQAESKTEKQRLRLLRRQLAASTAQLATSRHELEVNKAYNLKMLKDLATRTRDMRSSADMLALADVKVREGEELARTTIPAYSTPEETLAKIQFLLTRVRQTARDRGAKRKAQYLEAYLRNSQLTHMLGPSVNSVNLPEKDAVKLLVGLVSDCRWDVVLRAQAVQNTAETEPIPFDIQPYWNRLAFRKGEEIASTTIDPSLTPGQIMEQLTALLKNKVRQASIARQVIPGPRNELGEVRFDPLLEVTEKVKRLGVPAKVGVVAAREVWSADPLQIDFFVVPAEKAVVARAEQVVDAKQ